MDLSNRPKLLLADDSVTIRKVVELTFADEGINVATAADSATAMSRFVEMQPDIVLVDVSLDGTSGYQICEMIKADEATRHIPGLLLVGSFEPFDQDEAERVGADGFLTKPFHSIRDLVARVWDLLRPSETATSAVPAMVDSLGLEHLSMDRTSISPEDDDIENLYRSSFADTVEIDEYDTVDDMLGDPALDDEMIEASYLGDASSDGLEGLIAEPKVTESKNAFDWSPEALVSDTNGSTSAASTFEPKFVFDETAGEESAQETQAFERITDDEDLALGALIGSNGAEPVGQINVEDMSEDVEPETQSAADEIEEPPAEASVKLTITPTETAEPEVANEKSFPAITPEMMDVLADKIVARLSDRVVREVALEAVPRIAEKLIREALSDTGKTSEAKERSS